MGEKSNIFQIALLGIFGALAGVGLLIFATLEGDQESVLVSGIEIWGSYSKSGMQSAIADLNKSIGGLSKVTYTEKPPELLYGDLIEALASGTGPDIVIMDDDRLVPFLNKVYWIDYENYSQRLFRDTFVEGGEVFAFPSAIYALPFTVDPLVLYWNRSMFSTAGITQVPKSWEELVRIVPQLSVVVDGADLVQGALAFGVYDNVLNAKDILSALLMQAGTSIVRHENQGLRSTLQEGASGSTRPAEAALRFYTDFSNPKKAVYSWNHSFERSRESFMSGRVAMYIGFVSEAETMRKINPNLNFDVAVLPQSKSRSYPTTYGHFQGLVIMRSSRDPGRAYAVAQRLTSAQAIARFQEVTKLPPVRRDLLARRPSDSAGDVAYESAILSRSWLEPDSSAVDGIFGRMTGSIVSGRTSISEAISVASRELEVLLPDQY
jgi:multiple sugar transport system substrate-binding protein